MKRKIIMLIVIFLIIAIIAGIAIYQKNNNKTDGNSTVIKMNEVTRSVFYAPQYVAINNGYFKDYNIEIDLTTGQGADAVMTSVLSGESQIGFAGPEASIYVYNSDNEDYIVSFAGLTKRDGAFLVSREKIDNFKLEDLKGKYVIGGRKGGMPEMTFEYTLKENNIDLNDLTIDTSVDFASMAGTFISGVGDFVTLFEPSATQVEQKGYGYVVGYIGEYGGSVPYTAYNARKSYISENKDTIQKFTNAINKGLDFVWNNDEETVAKVIVNQFPDLTINELSKMIKRYKDNDAWMKNTYFTEESFDHLQDIMIEAGELKTKVPYKDLVDTSFSKSE